MLSQIFFMRRIAFGSFLEEDETIIRVFHRPLFFLLVKLFLWGPILGGVVFLAWFFFPYRELYLGLAILGGLKIFSVFFFWYINSVLMTNESIVYVDWPRFFEKRSTRIDYSNLDEITTEKVGVAAFFLNYGNIYFKKLGGDNLATHMIASPTRTARIIEKYREEHVDRKNFNQESTLKGILASMAKNHLEDTGYTSGNLERNMESRGDENKVLAHNKKSDRGGATSRNIVFDDIEIEKTLDDTGGIDLRL